MMAQKNAAGLSIRRIATATGLSSSRVHQLLHTDEAKEIPVWLNQLCEPRRPSDDSSAAHRPSPALQARLANEVEV
jgi:hypothetical protein